MLSFPNWTTTEHKVQLRPMGIYYCSSPGIWWKHWTNQNFHKIRVSKLKVHQELIYEERGHTDFYGIWSASYWNISIKITDANLTVALSSVRTSGFVSLVTERPQTHGTYVWLLRRQPSWTSMWLPVQLSFCHRNEHPCRTRSLCRDLTGHPRHRIVFSAQQHIRYPARNHSWVVSVI